MSDNGQHTVASHASSIEYNSSLPSRWGINKAQPHRTPKTTAETHTSNRGIERMPHPLRPMRPKQKTSAVAPVGGNGAGRIGFALWRGAGRIGRLAYSSRSQTALLVSVSQTSTL